LENRSDKERYLIKIANIPKGKVKENDLIQILKNVNTTELEVKELISYFDVNKVGYVEESQFVAGLKEEINNSQLNEVNKGDQNQIESISALINVLRQKLNERQITWEELLRRALISAAAYLRRKDFMKLLNWLQINCAAEVINNFITMLDMAQIDKIFIPQLKRELYLTIAEFEWAKTAIFDKIIAYTHKTSPPKSLESIFLPKSTPPSKPSKKAQSHSKNPPKTQTQTKTQSTPTLPTTLPKQTFISILISLPIRLNLEQISQISTQLETGETTPTNQTPQSEHSPEIDLTLFLSELTKYHTIFIYEKNNNGLSKIKQATIIKAIQMHCKQNKIDLEAYFQNPAILDRNLLLSFLKGNGIVGENADLANFCDLFNDGRGNVQFQDFLRLCAGGGEEAKKVQEMIDGVFQQLWQYSCFAAKDLLQIFTDMDLDQNNYIDKTEFAVALETMQFQMNQTFLDLVFSYLDKNKDGFISYIEFCEQFKIYTAKTQVKSDHWAFPIFEKIRQYLRTNHTTIHKMFRIGKGNYYDRNIYITPITFKNVLAKMNIFMRPELLQRIMNLISTEKKAQLDFLRFCKLIGYVGFENEQREMVVPISPLRKLRKSMSFTKFNTKIQEKEKRATLPAGFLERFFTTISENIVKKKVFIKDAFIEQDIYNDLTVSFPQFRTIIQSLTGEFTNEQIDSIGAEFDYDNNGLIHYQNLLAKCEEVYRETILLDLVLTQIQSILLSRPQRSLYSLFQSQDLQKGKKFSKEDLEIIFKANQINLKPREVDLLVARFDPQQEGKLDFYLFEDEYKKRLPKRDQTPPKIQITKVKTLNWEEENRRNKKKRASPRRNITKNPKPLANSEKTSERKEEELGSKKEIGEDSGIPSINLEEKKDTTHEQIMQKDDDEDDVKEMSQVFEFGEDPFSPTAPLSTVNPNIDQFHSQCDHFILHSTQDQRDLFQILKLINENNFKCDIQLHQRFKQSDVEQNSRISVYDFELVIRSLGIVLSQSELDQLIQSFANNGTINYEHFLKQVDNSKDPFLLLKRFENAKIHFLTAAEEMQKIILIKKEEQRKLSSDINADAEANENKDAILEKAENAEGELENGLKKLKIAYREIEDYIKEVQENENQYTVPDDVEDTSISVVFVDQSIKLKANKQ
jgi:Ca2+-binding EF-hand superfamily protein